jgi:hypothetical protein
MYHWIEGGCARDKLNIGIPTYGRAFSGEDPLKAWGQSGGGSGGLTSKYLGESGIQTYFEVIIVICFLITQSLRVLIRICFN